MRARQANEVLSAPNQPEDRPAPEWDLKEARRIVLDGLVPYHCDVYLIGSRAKGTMRRYSDIDIALDPEEPLPYDLIPALRDRLDESHIIYHVDLVDLSQTSTAFREKVIKDGVRWTA